MGPGRTPTVHRCPKGKAVGRPHETTSDRRPNETDRRQDKRAFNETGVDGTRQVLTHTWILDNDESPSSCWTNLQSKFGTTQEHQFRGSQEFVRYHAEIDLEHAAKILNVSTIEWTFSLWTISTLLHAQGIKWAKAKVHVNTDSGLCLEKMQEHSGANKKWTDQLREFQQCTSYRELFGNDGEPIEFWVEYFPRTCVIDNLRKDPNESATSKE